MGTGMARTGQFLILKINQNFKKPNSLKQKVEWQMPGAGSGDTGEMLVKGVWKLPILMI